MTQQEQGPKLKGAERWQKVARRIRVPLGFLTAAFFISSNCGVVSLVPRQLHGVCSLFCPASGCAPMPPVM